MDNSKPQTIDRTRENYDKRSEALVNIIFTRLQNKLDDDTLSRLSIEDEGIKYKVAKDSRERYIFYTNQQKNGRRKTGKMDLVFYRSNRPKKMYEEKVNIFDKCEEITEHTISAIESLEYKHRQEQRRKERREKTNNIYSYLEEAGFKGYYFNKKGMNLKVEKGGSYGPGFRIKKHSFDVDPEANMDDVIAKLREIESLYKELDQIVKGE